VALHVRNFMCCSADFASFVFILFYDLYSNENFKTFSII